MENLAHMKKHKTLVLLLSFIFFSTAADSMENIAKVLPTSFKDVPQMAISIDPFLPGARGITVKGEFEMAIWENCSFLIPFRAVLIDSENFPFLFKSGYAHLDPYNYVDDFLKFFDSTDIIQEQEYTLGIGVKLHPSSKIFQNGFYIKPLLTVGYAKLNYEHKKVNMALDAPWIGKISVPIKDEDVSKQINSIVFVPEILVGYNMLFTSHLLLSLEIGAKYRLFNQDFVKYVPRLTGFEPSLSFMFGYTW